ncbi:MAG: hypothetical protein KDC38_21990, partial [Planctomycetes bacterium]|nr:hypothetical protein [Planctomycetota bacterium]
MSAALPDVLRVAGVDVGSSAVKAVVMEVPASGTPTMTAGRTERIRRRDPSVVANELFEACLGDAGWRADELHYVATTGEGDTLEFRTGHFYGMTTHARVFTVRHDEDGVATLRFGDGRSGARLPTGLENVIAAYRKGAG